MRVELDDAMGYRHTIDSGDPELVGRWFVEKALLLMSSNVTVGDCRLRIWPSTHDEQQLIGTHEAFLTRDKLRKLAEALLMVSGTLGETGPGSRK